LKPIVGIAAPRFSFDSVRQLFVWLRGSRYSSHPRTNGHDGQGGSLPQQKRSSSGGRLAGGGGQRAQYPRSSSAGLRRNRPQRLHVGLRVVGASGVVIGP
jgi:hypothetical protein